MKFRSRLFGTLSWLTLLALIGSTLLFAGATRDTIAQGASEGGLYQASAAFAGTTFIATALCIGVPLFVLFSFLAWRNDVGYKAQQRHKELLNRAL